MISTMRIVKGVSLAVILSAVVSIGHVAYGQSSTPVAEVFGGYSFTSLDGSNLVSRQETHGFGVSGSVNLNRYLGLTGEFSHGWGSLKNLPVTLPVDVDFTTQTFMFGPTVSARGERVTAFGHALFGGMRSDARVNVIPVSLSETRFAMGFGGGIDINVGNHFAIRTFQIDYIPVRDEGFWSHNYRFQTGVVFRF